ncbi:MAG: hypothetical protein QM656_14870 [Paracoccaceae bacterium]
MSRLRSFIVLVLIVAVLPWGAWSGVRAAVLRSSLQAEAPAGLALPQARTAGPDKAGTVLLPAWICAGKAMPGTHCGSDVVFLPPPVVPGAPELAAPLTTTGAVLPAGRAPRPPLDPPRPT